jgi:hypothetical protein
VGGEASESSQGWESADVPALSTVARGVSAGGAAWTIEAGGTRDECLTFLDVELADGTLLGGGGLGGPALYSDRMTNISWHRAEPDFAYVVGRVHPTVSLVRLTLSGPGSPTIDVAPTGDSARFGVRYVAAVLPSDTPLMAIRAFDDAGRLLDEQSDERQAGLLDRPPGDDDQPPTSGHDSGWRP